MATKLLPEQKKFLNTSQDVKNICKPLFEHSKINGFSFARLYTDNRLIYLSSHADWLENYFVKKYHPSTTIKQNPECLLRSYTLWSTVKNNPVLLDLNKNFGFFNGVSVLLKEDNYIDIFNYATSEKDDEVINWFINNMELANKFALFFKEKSNDIIKNLSPYRSMLFEGVLNKENLINSDKKGDELLRQLHCCSINTRGQNYQLTVREHQCVNYVMKGLTAKAIGKKMNLSQRTIEFYIKNIKDKFKCQYKSELVELLLDSDFIGE